MVGHEAMGHNDRHTVSHQLRLWLRLRKLLLNLFVQNKEIRVVRGGVSYKKLYLDQVSV